MIYLLLLSLIIVANGAPLLGNVVLKHHFALPLDFGWKIFDGRPLLGPSKTLRGLLLSLAMTMLFAPLIGLSVETGFVVSMWAMLGDCLASFTKRRLGMKPESQAILLDQVPESLFPLLAMQSAYDLEYWGVVITVIAFVALDVVLSRILFRFHLRKHPY